VVYKPTGAASEALPVPERQLIAVGCVELMMEAVGCCAPVQEQIDKDWVKQNRNIADGLNKG
jgi:hypothetical protein